MPLLDRRLEDILHAIVAEYTRTALPVASKTLVERSGIALSPASIRSVMALLEEQGFLAAPHTSSGRIPTETAYAYLLHRGVLAQPQIKTSIRVRVYPGRSEHPKQMALQVGKILSSTSEETVLISSPDGFHFFCGFSKLFQKPDFSDVPALRELSSVFDDMPRALLQVHKHEGRNVSVLVGEESPFGSRISTLVTSVSAPKHHLYFSILGPLRMEYGRNVALLQEARSSYERLFHSL